MEGELTELFETVKMSADRAENSVEEEDRCINSLKKLKKFPVNYDVLVSTQVGKRLRQLTKHRSEKIKVLASDVVEIWKDIIVKETLRKKKKNGVIENGESVKAESSGAEPAEKKTFKRESSYKREVDPDTKKLRVEKSPDSSTSSSDKYLKSETSSLVIDERNSPNDPVDERKVKLEKKPAVGSVAPPKLTSLLLCKDPVRDKVREILSEAMNKVYGEVGDDSEFKDRVYECDPNRVAVNVESEMFEKWGKSTGAQKFKYRSILFNIKDTNNPDFRRKVLTGEIAPKDIVNLTPEQMASEERQSQNEKIKQKALFNSERAAAPKASTNEFRCGRCKKKECTYYQMQTRSADEPMTTYVTCVNCGNHWKFC